MHLYFYPRSLEMMSQVFMTVGVLHSLYLLYSVRLSYVPPADIEHLLSSQTCAGSYVSLPPGCLLPDLVDQMNPKYQHSS